MTIKRSFSEEKRLVSLGMRTYAGSFFESIGMALTHADESNAKKLRKTFPNEWEKYLEYGIYLNERELENIQGD